jgi:hypothetical protein
MEEIAQRAGEDELLDGVQLFLPMKLGSVSSS